MNINEETWKAIEILMTKSFWGTNSSKDSLIRNLENEVKEFIEECDNNDLGGTIEEAADVIMILLCILFKNNKDKLFSIDNVMLSIINKLHRRYGPIYNDEIIEEAVAEELVWKEAKEKEGTLQFVFCDNKSCCFYGKVGGGNIKYEENRYFCAGCNQTIKMSKKNTLLYNRKKQKQYIQIIFDYILQYVRGNEAAPELLRIDNPEIYDCVCRDILTSEEIRDVFEGYISEKFSIEKKDVEQFLNSIDPDRIKMNNNTELLEYIRQLDDCTIDQYPVRKVKKIRLQLSGLTMDVIKKVEKVAEFNARSWNNQLVHKYLLRYDKHSTDRIIECMSIFHYKDEHVRDLTIELSNMYNCIVGCKFCASGALPESVYVLEPIDYVRQLNTCTKESGINPFEFENFYVSFAGIGEPSVVYKNIARGMQMIHDLYPHVQFNIATFGYDIKCFEYWNKTSHYIRTLQIPYYSYRRDKLQEVVKNLPEDYDFLNILRGAVTYKVSHNNCRIKINYIVMMNVNDSDEDIQYLCKILKPYNEFLAVKVSYLNYTKPGEVSNLVSPGTHRLKEIQDIFKQNGFSSYIFGTSFNTEVGCGQLIQNHISSINQ